MTKKASKRKDNSTEVLQFMSRKEVARLLNRTLRRIDQYAQKGLLKRIKINGQKNGIGFLVSDVRKLLKVESGAKKQI